MLIDPSVNYFLGLFELVHLQKRFNLGFYEQELLFLLGHKVESYPSLDLLHD